MRTPAVRLVPAPALEPPFDDQRAPEVCLPPPDAGAQLVLTWCRPEAAPVAAPPFELPAGASPAARHAALRFLGRCQEIFNGYRPASHIRALSMPVEAQTIMEQVAAVARRTTRLPRTAQPGRAGGPQPVTRSRVHVCEPRAGAAEAMSVLSQANRRWAIAFRLERHGAAWLCTAFTDVTQQPR